MSLDGYDRRSAPHRSSWARKPCAAKEHAASRAGPTLRLEGIYAIWETFVPLASTVIARPPVQGDLHAGSRQ
jgi:hypothetical protein